MPAEHHYMSHLLQGIAPVLQGDDVAVTAVTADSRRVQAGGLFMATRGETHDGRAFIADALSAGAAAIVREADEAEETAGDQHAIPVWSVSELHRYCGVIADRFFDAPSRKIGVIAITGTNGKTTCAWLLAQALEQIDGRCGVVGTLGSGFIDQLGDATLTTPDAVALHQTLDTLVRDGAKNVAMEISSHALAQHRASGLHADVAVFTNLTQDHLDYHGDMASYGAAKASLFDFPGLSAGVVNCADSFGNALATRLGKRGAIERLVTFGSDDADVRMVSAAAMRGGLRVELGYAGEIHVIDSSLTGLFNAENIACVFAVLMALQISPRDAADAIADAGAAPGRMEVFRAAGDTGPVVIVDFAHTPDALEKALVAARAHTAGELWCVFGCGGDRDREKRPLMGRIAADLADHVVVTDDNPRTEASPSIIDDIVSGLAPTPRIIADRPQAIAWAIAQAASDDVVLIAGKGHETTQTIGTDTIYMSDRDMAAVATGGVA